MKTNVMLENKDIRKIIAMFLGIDETDVIPQRYSFSVVGMTTEEIEKKLNLDRNLD